MLSCHDDNGEASAALLDILVAAAEAAERRYTYNVRDRLANCTGDLGALERFSQLNDRGNRVDVGRNPIPQYSDRQIIAAYDHSPTFSPNMCVASQWMDRIRGVEPTGDCGDNLYGGTTESYYSNYDTTDDYSWDYEPTTWSPENYNYDTTEDYSWEYEATTWSPPSYDNTHTTGYYY